MKLWNKFFVLRHPDDESGAAPLNDDSSAGSGAIGTGNDARLAILSAINDRNDIERADELASINDDDTTEPFIPENAAAPDSDADDADDAVEPSTPELSAEPEATPVAVRPKIKVNGEEIELTDELIAKAQKIASADKYLENAKHPPVQQPPAKPQPSAEDVEREQVERDRRLVRAIQVGSEEEAVAALREVRESARPSTMTVDDVGRIADERLSFKTALSWFNDEYKDLASDPQMKAIVEDRDDALVKAGDTRTYKERFDAIGKEVRTWRDSLVAKYAPKPEPVQDLKIKEAKKAAAPKAPNVANSTNKPTPEPDDQDEAPSSVIAKMANARGGPQWMRH